ncbi:hypothetical protein ACQP1G_16665 [Nocardia sp. CA-107356]|uniref:hypothetical protein n=1 Tax=Nocardia sp. CA-107356 TaxID=3239972 RepID=UPI003D8CD4C9
MWWTKIPNAKILDSDGLSNRISDYTYAIQLWLLVVSIISAARIGLARRQAATEHAEEAFKALARATVATWIAGAGFLAATRLTDDFSGEVAVPYGTCTEPTNVKAGGGACPLRFRCAGCDHFRTNIAYLPDLQAYLDDLLRTRERLAAALDGVDDGARADATPTQEEITRIRRLISRIKSDLDDTERGRIDGAVAIVRHHRAAHSVPLGMPILTTAPTSSTMPASEASA